MMNNIPEGAELDIRNPSLEVDEIEETEELDYEYWREEQDE